MLHDFKNIDLLENELNWIVFENMEVSFGIPLGEVSALILLIIYVNN